MPYRAQFRCIAGCDGEHALTEPIYRCPTCNDLLEVEHDLAALGNLPPKSWKQLFDDRYKRTTWPYGSSVWGKKEWVCPDLEDDNIVSMDEGGTNLLWAERFGNEIGPKDLWIKLCGNSHSGSFKDLGMTVLVSVVRQMISEGRTIQAIACASTGDTSAALAAYSAAAGIPAIVILPRGKVSSAQLLQPLANGATVFALDTDFDGCMAIVQRLAAEKRIYLANSMNSLRLEGQKTVAIEITQQFDWEVPDVLIIPGGNLGNVSALGAGLLELWLPRQPKLIPYTALTRTAGILSRFMQRALKPQRYKLEIPFLSKKRLRRFSDTRVSLNRRRKRNWPMPQLRQTSRACSTVPTLVLLSQRLLSSDGAGRLVRRNELS